MLPIPLSASPSSTPPNLSLYTFVEAESVDIECFPILPVRSSRRCGKLFADRP
jgi:hypothetical protein